MSRRNKHAEQHFGSDSFLDVLANMVGILIILVVVSGIRAARMPAKNASANPMTASIAAPVPVAPVETPVESEPKPVIAQLPPPPLEPEEPTAEELARLRALEAELAALDAQAAGNRRLLQKVRAEEDVTKQQLAARDRQLAARATELEDGKSRLNGLRQAVGAERKKLSGLIAEFEEVKNSQAPVVEVKHRLTPVSQSIVGEELHFRLAENKVSVIPLEQLIDRLKLQIERQKEMMARFRQHQGVVGPVAGFTLQYQVERQSLSVLDEMRHGSGAFRLAVSKWELVPEPDLEAEDAEQALKPGSRFVAALLNAPPKASLTLWVYPDSFGLFRKLQAATQAEGFVVSARPLPFGIPIAGSPHGTRSAGQ